MKLPHIDPIRALLVATLCNSISIIMLGLILIWQALMR